MVPIKEVLLSQSVIVAVGNIYASEALFVAKINPLVRACDVVSEARYPLLIAGIIQVLKLAYDNCGTTFSKYVDGSGTKSKNLEFLQVFQRHGQPCFACHETIEPIHREAIPLFIARAVKARS